VERNFRSLIVILPEGKIGRPRARKNGQGRDCSRAADGRPSRHAQRHFIASGIAGAA
jgi:hypothetical protein